MTGSGEIKVIDSDHCARILVDPGFEVCEIWSETVRDRVVLRIEIEFRERFWNCIWKIRREYCRAFGGNEGCQSVPKCSFAVPIEPPVIDVVFMKLLESDRRYSRIQPPDQRRLFLDYCDS